MKHDNPSLCVTRNPKGVFHIITRDCWNDLIFFVLLAIPHKISLKQGRPGGGLAGHKVYMQLGFKLDIRYFCTETRALVPTFVITVVVKYTF